MNRFSILILALCAACCSPGAPETPLTPDAPAPLVVEAPESPEVGADGLTLERRLQVLKSYVDWLAEHLPLTANVRIMFEDLEGEGIRGYADWLPAEDSYLIVLDKGLDLNAMIETMGHEWAHALAWRFVEDTGQDGHGPAWGIAYSQTYLAFLAWQEATFGD